MKLDRRSFLKVLSVGVSSAVISRIGAREFDPKLIQEITAGTTEAISNPLGISTEEVLVRVDPSLSKKTLLNLDSCSSFSFNHNANLQNGTSIVKLDSDPSKPRLPQVGMQETNLQASFIIDLDATNSDEYNKLVSHCFSQESFVEVSTGTFSNSMSIPPLLIGKVESIQNSFRAEELLMLELVIRIIDTPFFTGPE